jgi:hypothetical protein
MAAKKTAVFGIYQNEKQAERSVDDLLGAGYSNDDISVLLPDNKGTRDFAHDKSTKAPEGTAAGVTTGGVIGGTLGLLAGIGVLAIPGIGSVDCGRADPSRSCRPRSRRRSRRYYWRAGWDGNS